MIPDAETLQNALGPAAAVEALEADQAAFDRWAQPGHDAIDDGSALVVANSRHPLANRLAELAGAYGFVLILSPGAPEPPAVGFIR